MWSAFKLLNVCVKQVCHVAVAHCLIRGIIRKFSVPCTSSYQEKKFDHFFNIISLQGNVLRSSLFEVCYPFKIEDLALVPQVLFSASMTPLLLPYYEPRR